MQVGIVRLNGDRSQQEIVGESQGTSPQVAAAEYILYFVAFLAVFSQRRNVELLVDTVAQGESGRSEIVLQDVNTLYAFPCFLPRQVVGFEYPSYVVLINRGNAVSENEPPFQCGGSI